MEEREEITGFEEDDQDEIGRERKKLALLQQDYNEALDSALGSRPKQAKRALGEDEPRPEDEKMEEETVEALDPAGVADLYRARLKEQQERVSRLEGLARKELVPVRICDAGAPKEVQGREEKEDEKQQMPTRVRTSRWQAEEEFQEAEEKRDQLDEKRNQKESGGISESVLEEEIAKARHQVQVNMEIMVQERMQLQQEQELEQVAKLAVVRRQAAEIEERRVRTRQC